MSKKIVTKMIPITYFVIVWAVSCNQALGSHSGGADVACAQNGLAVPFCKYSKVDGDFFNSMFRIQREVASQINIYMTLQHL